MTDGRFQEDPLEPGARRDPVCGRSVYPATAWAEVVHAGRQYYFCSVECAERFRRDPGAYEEVPDAAS